MFFDPLRIAFKIAIKDNCCTSLHDMEEEIRNMPRENWKRCSNVEASLVLFAQTDYSKDLQERYSLLHSTQVI